MLRDGDESLGTSVVLQHLPYSISSLPPNEQFVVITFYTPKEKYINTLNRLLDSCKQFNITCIPTQIQLTIEEGDSASYDDLLLQKSIKHNLLSLKARFISSQLKKHKKGVLYVDSDMVFKGFPVHLTGLVSQDKDMLLIDWYPESWGITTSSGVMFFNYTARSILTLEAWSKALLYGSNKYAPDDQVFDTFFSYHNWDKKVSLGVLGFEYLYLNDWKYSHTDKPILIHPDKSSPWPKVKPTLPPMDWLTRASFNDPDRLQFLIFVGCDHYLPVREKIMDDSYLNKPNLSNGEAVMALCRSFPITVSFWNDVKIYNLDTDLALPYVIELQVPSPKFLGCSPDELKYITFEGDMKFISARFCSMKCFLPFYKNFQVTKEGYCRCGDVAVSSKLECLDKQCNSSLVDCPSGQYPTFSNDFTKVAVNRGQINLDQYFPDGSEIYSFFITSPPFSEVPLVSFTKFIVHSTDFYGFQLHF